MANPIIAGLAGAAIGSLAILVQREQSLANQQISLVDASIKQNIKLIGQMYDLEDFFFIENYQDSRDGRKNLLKSLKVLILRQCFNYTLRTDSLSADETAILFFENEMHLYEIDLVSFLTFIIQILTNLKIKKLI